MRTWAPAQAVALYHRRPLRSSSSAGLAEKTGVGAPCLLRPQQREVARWGLVCAKMSCIPKRSRCFVAIAKHPRFAHQLRDLVLVHCTLPSLLRLRRQPRQCLHCASHNNEQRLVYARQPAQEVVFPSHGRTNVRTKSG